MIIIKKSVLFILAVIILIGNFFHFDARAKDLTLTAPKFKIKSVNKGTGVQITILKTKYADGYEISWDYSGNKLWGQLYGDYGPEQYYDGPYFNGSGAFLNNANIFDLKLIFEDYKNGTYITNPYKLDMDGGYKRTFTIKNLQPGEYVFKVRAYHNDESGLLTYSDFSEELKVKLKGIEYEKGYCSSYDFSSVKKGDTILFGSYEQDKDYSNGREPIEWIVLKKTKKEMMVISKYILETLPYNNYWICEGWENSTLRKWLNNTFYNMAFRKEEQNLIKLANVKNVENSKYGTNAGNDTKDKVFILSESEVTDYSLGFEAKYDTYDINRICACAWDKGVIVESRSSAGFSTIDGEPGDRWWLRSPGSNRVFPDGDEVTDKVSRFCFVDIDGTVNLWGDIAFSEGYGIGVRPALYIKLK